MEYLNLDYHIKRLLLIAITRYKTKPQQAKALGITERTLTNYFKRYNINYREIKANDNNRITEQGGSGNA